MVGISPERDSLLLTKVEVKEEMKEEEEEKEKEKERGAVDGDCHKIAGILFLSMAEYFE